MSKFVLDAGHGGKDAGAVNGALLEKDAALRLVKLLGAELESMGHEVVYTRSDDTFVELHQRCVLSNAAAPAAFVSIHLNSSENKHAYGAETWYCEGSSKGLELATKIQSNIIAATGARDRGIKAGSFYVLKHSQAPAVLIEVGFISNDLEGPKLFTSEYQSKLVTAIANALD